MVILKITSSTVWQGVFCERFSDVPEENAASTLLSVNFYWTTSNGPREGNLQSLPQNLTTNNPNSKLDYFSVICNTVQHCLFLQFPSVSIHFSAVQ